MLKPIIFALSMAASVAVAPIACAEGGDVRDDTMDIRHDLRDIREENLHVPQDRHDLHGNTRERNVDRRDLRNDRRKGSVTPVKADRKDLR